MTVPTFHAHVHVHDRVPPPILSSASLTLWYNSISHALTRLKHHHRISPPGRAWPRPQGPAGSDSCLLHASCPAPLAGSPLAPPLSILSHDALLLLLPPFCSILPASLSDQFRMQSSQLYSLQSLDREGGNKTGLGVEEGCATYSPPHAFFFARERCEKKKRKRGRGKKNFHAFTFYAVAARRILACSPDRVWCAGSSDC